MNKKGNIGYGLMFVIAWLSVILFLVDYASRMGKWKIHFIAMIFVILTVIGAIEDINKKKRK